MFIGCAGGKLFKCEGWLPKLLGIWLAKGAGGAIARDPVSKLLGLVNPKFCWLFIGAVVLNDGKAPVKDDAKLLFPLKVGGLLFDGTWFGINCFL